MKPPPSITQDTAAGHTHRKIYRSVWSRSRNVLVGIPPTLAWAISLGLLTHTVQAASATASSVNNNSFEGTLKLDYWVNFPSLPAIITEWAALIPLTVYLSSFRSNFELSGEVSLRGRLSVSIVPKLWALGGIAKLLGRGEAFFDAASAAGDPLTVYDVQWGGKFPCYNSAATAAVIATAFNGREDFPEISQHDLNVWISDNQNELREQFADFGIPLNKATSDVHPETILQGLGRLQGIYRRRQLLNVIDVRKIKKRTRMMTSRWGIGSVIAGNQAWLLFQMGLILGLTALLVACGCIGSGILLAIGGISRYCAQRTNLKRPNYYLKNTESYDSCALVIPHENVAIWTLFRGERALIDSLLNKPMIEPGKTHPLVLAWFRFAEILQVITMTYVAGQKGWDGIILLSLVILVWSSSKFYGYNRHAARWLEEEEYKTTAFGCEFFNRTALLGTVQMLSTQKKTLWMDGIIPHSMRRDVWLKKIGAIDCNSKEVDDQYTLLDKAERDLVNSTGMQSTAGATLILAKLKEKNADDRDFSSPT